MIVAKYRRSELISNYTILTILALFSFLPILLLFFNSIKAQEEFGINPLGFPSQIRFLNFYDAWILGEYAQIFINSSKLVIGTIVICLTCSGLAGFSLARLNPKGSTIFLIYLLVGISIPAQMFILPLFLLWKELNLMNTHLGLIIIYSGLNAPFATFLIRSYMIKLPEELFDAARVDGANTLQLFFKIALPISWPVFLTAGLVVGLAVWNEFLFALTFMQDDEKKPMATILFAFQSRFENNWGLVSASAVMMAAPVVILFLLFQKRFIAGLTSGASKG
ncbi:MAG: L-arabinose transport system permease protein AraQ [Alphaproteobacteria bacterium MarineAlpha5_Bin5]|nr:MAG: L-arabinose transport system permease protein AraQ [Alphaproteobacteria bacterium MarineAlpha5_Bin5]|tara:strand:- start:234 stop:1070 length:837 start_codon:yes stop_codon:yes gene_type:complete